MNEHEPFLQRWSRLKTTPPGEPATSVDTPEAAAPAQDAEAQATAGEEPFDLTQLPRAEDLTADSDITGFLDRRVPQALRNAALRQAWSLDPTIRDFIEVAENQWNWNVPGGAPFYGPLDPGTDIAALLAQATGAMMKASDRVLEQAPDEDAREKLKGESSHASEPKITSETITALQHDAPTALHPSKPITASAIAELPEIKLIGSRREQVAIVPAPQQIRLDPPQIADLPRRRHGGALPE